MILDSDTVFTVRLSSEKTDKIRINTHVEGEYHENVVVNTSEENKTLTVTTGYSPFFEKENDKLAAHKVIAIDMELEIYIYCPDGSWAHHRKRKIICIQTLS